MNAIASDLAHSRRQFFGFIVKWGLIGSATALMIAAMFLLADLGGVLSLMLRSASPMLWIAFFCFDIWVTVTGLTLAIAFWGLGDWSDPPRD